MTETARILLIEDDPLQAALVRQLLEGYPDGLYTVDWQPSVRQGLAALAEGGFAAVLLDLDLPDSQGLDTVQTVVPAAGDVPVVALTAHAETETALAAVRAGAQDFVVKGLENGELLTRTLRYAVERAQLVALLHRQLAVQRAILDALPVAFLHVDRGGMVVSANHAAGALLGCAADDLIGCMPEECLDAALAEAIHAGAVGPIGDDVTLLPLGDADPGAPASLADGYGAGGRLVVFTAGERE